MKIILKYLKDQLPSMRLSLKAAVITGTLFLTCSKTAIAVTNKLNGFLDIDGIPGTNSLYEKAFNWVLYNEGYIIVILSAIALDHILSTWKYIVLNDFDFKKNLGGLFTKVALVVIGAWLFESMNIIIHKGNLVKEWLTIVTRLMVFFYPAYSAWKSMSILSKGVFPPKAWIVKIEKFKGNLNVEELFNKVKHSPNEQN